MIEKEVGSLAFRAKTDKVIFNDSDNFWLDFCFFKFLKKVKEELVRFLDECFCLLFRILQMHIPFCTYVIHLRYGLSLTLQPLGHLERNPKTSDLSMNLSI